MLKLFVIAALFFFGMFLNACASTAPSKPSPRDAPASQLDVEVLSSPQSPFDLPVERHSEAMRRFLMAELSMDSEDNEDAINDLIASRKLLKVPDLEIQMRLSKLYLRKGDLRSALRELDGLALDADGLNFHASLLQIAGKWPESLQLYRQALQQKPTLAEARVMLALEDLSAKRFSEVVTSLEILLSQESRHLPALRLLAIAYRGLGNIPKSTERLEQLRQLDPGDIFAFESLLAIGIESENFGLIQREIQRESRINPSNPLLPGLKGVDFRNQSSEVKDILLRNLILEFEQLPNPLQLRSELARFALLKQNFAEVIDQLYLILAVEANNDEARYNLALALSTTGRLREAIKQLKMVESESEWFVRAAAFAGLLHRQRSELDEAEKSFRGALRKDPSSEQMQSYLASVLKDAKKYDEAKKVFEDALKKDPKNERILFNYGVLLHDMKQVPQSIEAMQRLIAVNPSHAEALNFLAYDLAEQGKDLDRALDLSHRAIQLQPENGFFIDTRGWILFRMGKDNEALLELERAVDLSRGDPEIVEHLGDVYSKMGRRKEALQYYNNALDRLVDGKQDSEQESANRVRSKIEAFSK